MIFSTSMLKVNGVWRYLLIVESATENEFLWNDIVNNFTDEDGNEIEIIYYTEGLYKHIEENGKHYYWFLYNGMRMTINGVPNDEHLQALEVLGVEV